MDPVYSPRKIFGEPLTSEEGFSGIGIDGKVDSARVALFASPLTSSTELINTSSFPMSIHEIHAALFSLSSHSSTPDLQSIKEGIELLSKRMGDLEKEVARGGIDKQNLLSILKDIKSQIEKIILALNEFDKEKTHEINGLKESFNTLNANVQKNQELLDEMHKRSVPPASTLPLGTVDSLSFKEVLDKLQTLDASVEKMIATENDPSISFPPNWANDVQKALDDGINALDKKYNDEIAQIKDQIASLQQQVERQTEEIKELGQDKISLSLQNALLKNEVDKAVGFANLGEEQAVVRSLEEAYRFELLETFIGFIKRFKGKPLYDQLRTKIARLEKPDVPKEFQTGNADNITLATAEFDLKQGNYQFNKHYTISADTLHVHGYRQVGSHLTIKARKIVFYKGSFIDLTGKPGDPLPNAAADGTENRPHGYKGSKGNDGMPGGNISLVAASILFDPSSSGNGEKLKILLNGGKGGNGQKSGNGYSPYPNIPAPAPDGPEPKKMPKTIIVPNRGAVTTYDWSDPKPTHLRGGGIIDNFWGTVGASGKDGINGGNAYRGGAKGIGGMAGQFNKYLFDEDETYLEILQQKGDDGPHGLDGTPGKRSSGGLGGRYCFYCEPVSGIFGIFSAGPEAWQNRWVFSSDQGIVKYMADYHYIFEEIKAAHPDYTEGNVLKFRAKSGSDNSHDGQLLE